VIQKFVSVVYNINSSNRATFTGVLISP